MAPNISAREWIRWLPEASSEPTTTLVLTSAESRFVDIRIFRTQHGSEVVEANEDVLPASRIEWAIAGASSSVMRKPEDGGEKVVHSTWRHWVDSRSEDAEGVSDEGDMYPMGDGRTLEKGSMVNPATGKLTDYEELWKDVDPVSVERESAGDGHSGKKVCVVLQLESEEHKARGRVVRVGQFCQGVLRVGKHFSLERWEWKGKKEGWKRLVRIGDLWVPCGVATEEGRLRAGGEIKHGEYVWKVLELSEF